MRKRRSPLFGVAITTATVATPGQVDGQELSPKCSSVELPELYPLSSVVLLANISNLVRVVTPPAVAIVQSVIKLARRCVIPSVNIWGFPP